MTPEEVQRTLDGERAEQLTSALVAENRATRLLVASEHSNGREVLECGSAAPLSNGEEIPEKRHSSGALSRSRGTAATKTFWIAAEGLPMIQAVFPNARVEPELTVPDSVPGKTWERANAIREMVRGRMEVCGPITVGELSDILILPGSEIDAALLALEGEGFVLRGKFRPHATEQEWCDRQLLARIHRLTIDRLRAEIQPVSQQDFYRFLFAWQRADQKHRVEGLEGLQSVLEQLDGCELPLAAWESAVLAARVADYDPEWLDRLCFSGRIGWARLSAPQNPSARTRLRRGYGGQASAPLRTSPIALYQRENLQHWLVLTRANSEMELSVAGRTLFDTLAAGGALFFSELVRCSGLLPPQVEEALSQLAALGLVTWYELGRIYRRWEARGEIRGGYFVGGVSGEQFALPEAIGLLRSIRRTPPDGDLIALSAADPLNLQGVLTPGPRIAALTANRILFFDGLPIAALEAGEIRTFATANPSDGGVTDSSVSDLQIETALKVGKLRPSLRPYYK